MRGVGPIGILTGVDEKVVIHLEISLAGDSLIGSASDDRGAVREFDGRLGLLDAIDVLVAGSTNESHRPSEPE